jgi:hypothetical protein
MLREPQHERKILNVIKTPPFVPSINSGQALSPVEGLRQSFSTACQLWMKLFSEINNVGTCEERAIQLIGGRA